jgi:glucokinase
MTHRTAASGARLLADIGGTNARFAWQRRPGGEIECVETLACADHASLHDALAAYLGRCGRSPPGACAIAIANPVVGDQVTMTNHHWSFSIRDLKSRCGFERILVLNDFTALALALPALRADETTQVGGGAPQPASAIGLIGPGTGLGVSGLLPDGRGGWLPLHGEGGHATLAGTTPRERAVLDRIGERLGHVSAERAVCGQGLLNIHRALAELDGAPAVADVTTSAAVTERALAGQDAACVEALALFCAFLGIAAGNLALTLGARGGIYIGGGIVPRLGAWFATSPFRARFEAKGRFSEYLAAIPVYVIQTARSPALLGAALALDAEALNAGCAA